VPPPVLIVLRGIAEGRSRFNCGRAGNPRSSAMGEIGSRT